ncbi:DUF6683 family protein [Deinococcus rubellus]|uniref:DUF6683 family protein n=1 Tax=Deinococcus rubellus TaxID=1889240 RepID=UPI0031EBF226
MLLASIASADDSFASLFSSVDTSTIGAAAAKAVNAPANGPVTLKAFEYTPSARVSSDTRTLFINELVKQGQARGMMTPDKEKQLRAAFDKADVVKLWGAQLEPKGYKMNSLATATALWVAVSFQIMNDGQLNTDIQNNALLKQLQVAYSNSPEVVKLTDARKQKAAESLMWMAAFEDNDVTQARAGAKGYTMDAVKDYVSKLLINFKIDPAKFEIGDTGLHKKGN